MDIWFPESVQNLERSQGLRDGFWGCLSRGLCSLNDSEDFAKHFQEPRQAPCDAQGFPWRVLTASLEAQQGHQRTRSCWQGAGTRAFHWEKHANVFRWAHLVSNMIFVYLLQFLFVSLIPAAALI